MNGTRPLLDVCGPTARKTPPPPPRCLAIRRMTGSDSPSRIDQGDDSRPGRPGLGIERIDAQRRDRQGGSIYRGHQVVGAGPGPGGSDDRQGMGLPSAMDPPSQVVARQGIAGLERDLDRHVVHVREGSRSREARLGPCERCEDDGDALLFDAGDPQRDAQVALRLGMAGDPGNHRVPLDAHRLHRPVVRGRTHGVQRHRPATTVDQRVEARRHRACLEIRNDVYLESRPALRQALREGVEASGQAGEVQSPRAGRCAAHGRQQFEFRACRDDSRGSLSLQFLDALQGPFPGRRPAHGQRPVEHHQPHPVGSRPGVRRARFSCGLDATVLRPQHRQHGPRECERGRCEQRTTRRQQHQVPQAPLRVHGLFRRAHQKERTEPTLRGGAARSVQP